MFNTFPRNITVETKGVIKWVPIPALDLSSPFHAILDELLQQQKIGSVLVADQEGLSHICLIHSEVACFVQKAESLLIDQKLIDPEEFE